MRSISARSSGLAPPSTSWANMCCCWFVGAGSEDCWARRGATVWGDEGLVDAGDLLGCDAHGQAVRDGQAGAVGCGAAQELLGAVAVRTEVAVGDLERDVVQRGQRVLNAASACARSRTVPPAFSVKRRSSA